MGLHRTLESEHRTVEGEADHMADSAEGLRTGVAEGIGFGEGHHMAVADVEDSPVVVDMGYARELHMAAPEEGGTALAVADIRLAAHAAVGDNALVVVPAVVDIPLAAHDLEEGHGSRHSPAGVDNLVIAVDILEKGIAGAEAADNLLLICKHTVSVRDGFD